MMNPRPLFAISLLAFSSGCFLFQAAETEDTALLGNDNAYTYPEDFALVAGTPAGRINGHVRLADGTAVEGVTVRLSTGIGVTTDPNGAFLFTNVAPMEDIVVSVRDSHFTSAFQKVDIEDWETRSVELQLRPVGKVFKFNNEEGALLRDGPLSLSIPPNTFADNDGNIRTGQIRLSVTANDIREHGVQGAPGNFVGIDSTGTEVPLVSYGFFEVRADQDDTEVNVADGGSVGVTFELPNESELPSGQVGLLDSSVPLWWWNPESAIWEWVQDIDITENEDGTRHAYTELPHFSSWNYDGAYTSSCIDVTVLDIVGNPITGANVKLEGIDYSATWTVTTGSSGTARVIGLAGARARLTSSVSVDDEYYPDERNVTLNGSESSPCPNQETVVLPVCFLGGDLWTVVSNTLVKDADGRLTNYRVPAGGAVFYQPNGDLEACEHPLDTLEPGDWIRFEPGATDDYFGEPDLVTIDAGDIIRVHDTDVAIDFTPQVSESGDQSYGVIVTELDPSVVGDLVHDHTALDIRIQGATDGLAGVEFNSSISVAATPVVNDPVINLEIDDDKSCDLGIQPEDNPSGLVISVPAQDGSLLVGKFSDSDSPVIPDWVVKEMPTDTMTNIQITRPNSSWQRLPNGYYMRAETENATNVMVTVKKD